MSSHTHHILFSTFVILSALVTGVNSQPIALDTSFGTGGTIVVNSPGFASSWLHRAYVQPSGRIVGVGHHSRPGTSGTTVGFGLVGLSANGTVDTTFAGKGRYTDWSAAASNSMADSAMLPDGRLLVLSSFSPAAGVNRAILSRFGVNGAIETAFNANLNIHPDQTYPLKIALAGNSGKIFVLVGRYGSQDHSLVRLNPDGSRDTAYGNNGVRDLGLGRLPNRYILDVKVLSTGKLFFLGQSFIPDNFEYDFFAARFDENGLLDRSFGPQGIVRLPGRERLQGNVILEQPDGKLIIAGCEVPLGSELMVMRLTNRGKLDLSFGSGGIVTRQFGFHTHCASAAALRSDGSIVVAGTAGWKVFPSPPTKILVASFNSDGTFISHALTDISGGTNPYASSLFLQPDGKAVVAGSIQTPSGQFAVARYNP